MQRVQGRNISRSAAELKVEFLKHWKNNQSVTALRCTSSDLSKLESESFVFKVAVQAGRWRGWEGGHGNHTPSCKQRWCHPWNVLGNVPADGPRGWEQSKNPPGAAAFPSSRPQGTLGWLEPCKVTFSLWMLWQVWEAPRSTLCPPSPLCGGQGQLSASPKAPNPGRNPSAFFTQLRSFTSPSLTKCRSSQTTDWIYTELSLKQDNATGEDSKINLKPLPNNQNQGKVS